MADQVGGYNCGVLDACNAMTRHSFRETCNMLAEILLGLEFIFLLFVVPLPPSEDSPKLDSLLRV